MKKKYSSMKKEYGNMKEGYQVNFEVVVNNDDHGRSMFERDVYPNTTNLDQFRPPMDRNIEVARKLQKQGILVHHVGEFSISASCSANKFEKFFSTKISQIKLDRNYQAPEDYAMFAPRKGAPWDLPKKDALDKLIDKAYIQHPPIFFASERSIPPRWDDKFRLRVPTDVAQIMGASQVHRNGITGLGVKVVMPDTGFFHHPYFNGHGYNFLSVTAPDTVDHTNDHHGHGTGECANLFATAPGINFIGVKMGNPTLSIKTGVELGPDIITNSWGYSMDVPGTGLPNWLKPLHLTILDAVARGITVVFSAGNGHYGFPGSMPEVISVGGVVVDEDLKYSASDYTSGFMSTWFPGRRVPDICGLCGTRPRADYIILPVQSGAYLEKGNGWGAFSGTSAAAPMVAGICALLKEAEPDLSPNDIKNILKYTARDITDGINAHGEVAQPGPDGATGFGLVDAQRALETIR